MIMIFNLPIHSTVDLITNSSSELFMLETGKTLNTVRQMITEFASIWKGEPTNPWENGWIDPESLRLVELNWDPPVEARVAMRAVFDKGPWRRRDEAMELTRYLEKRQCVKPADSTPLPPYYDPAEETQPIADYIREWAASLWEDFCVVTKPAADYMVQWCPEMPLDHAHLILSDITWKNFKYLHPSVLEKILDGTIDWGFVQDYTNNILENTLQARGFDPELSSWFLYHILQPIKGRQVMFSTVDDNSIPGDFQSYLHSTLPSLNTWHLG